MNKKHIVLMLSIAFILGIVAFSVVKYTSDNKKTKSELDSYYLNTSGKNYPQYVVISEGVKLRLDPDTSAKEVTILKAGSTVEMLKKSDVITKVGSKEGYWYNIKYGEKYGWVFEAFIMEKDKVATELPQNYYSYIKGLSTKDVKSISLAVNKFKSSAVILTDKNTKDDMFRKFKVLYGSVIKNIQDTYFVQTESEEMLNYITSQTTKDPENIKWDIILNNLTLGEGISDQALKDKLSQLKNNGLQVNIEEGMFFINEEPTFILSNFSSYVSQEIKDFLSLKSKDLKEGYSEDASLTITWDELSDRIASWDNYTKKYPSSPETIDAKNLLKGYVLTYFYGMDNSSVTGHSEDMVLIDALQKSYERFMQKYPDSSYYPIVRNYYNMLLNNNFKINDQSQAFLKSNGIN